MNDHTFINKCSNLESLKRWHMPRVAQTTGQVECRNYGASRTYADKRLVCQRFAIGLLLQNVNMSIIIMPALAL